MVKKPQLPLNINISYGSLAPPYRVSDWAKVVREMRRDPTIFLARLMVRAPILAAQWTIEQDDDSLTAAKDFIYNQLIPIRTRVLDACISGLLDWGWIGFEKVFAIENESFVLKKFKPLLQEITTIKATDYGDFNGFSQDSFDEGLPKFYATLININQEGDNLYGESYMINAYKSYARSETVTETAEKYDKKIAGAHWIITFPEGVSNLNGVETKNEDIAKSLITALEGSGSFAIPQRTLDVLEGLNADAPNAWKIDLKEASGSGDNFDSRLSRYDKEKVRAFGLPERTILEGQFGTKAEAIAHGDFALTGIEQLGQRIVEQLNNDVVSQLLRINFGISSGVYIKQQPIQDIAISSLRAIYDKVLSQPDGLLSELSTLDIDAMRDRLGIPYKKVVLNDPQI